MRQAIAVLTLAALTVSPPVSAQTIEDNTRALAYLQSQLDQAQAPAAAAAGLYGHTDAVALVGSVLYVSGWAADCPNRSVEGVEVEIDGVIRPEARVPHGFPHRIERPDVTVCAPISIHSGVLMALNLSAYSPLLPHTVALRIRNRNGIGKRLNGIFIFDCGDGRVCVQPEAGGAPERRTIR